jgi:short-subunit dehydrogenase
MAPFFGLEIGMNIHSSTRESGIMKSESKTILITGATAGIGRHAALHLVDRGYDVIATGRNREALDKLRAESRGRLHVVRLDVTDAKSIAQAVVEVDGITGGRGVDVLVNNAGYGLAAPLEEVTDEDLRAQFETNVFGLMAVTRAFLPRMRARGSGRIINVGSVGGRITFPLFGAYHATKYAVEAISDALRRELSAWNIQVALIEPGPIKTEFANRTMQTVEKYRSATSPFAPVYARADELRAMTDRQSVGPESVVRAIEHAARARRPRARYVMPFSARLMLGFLNRLPTRLVDWIMTRLIGLSPKRLAAARSAAKPETEPNKLRAAS